MQRQIKRDVLWFWLFCSQEACSRTNGGLNNEVRFGFETPKAGYLCAGCVPFLLRLSPNGCTKEHKALYQKVAKAFLRGLYLPSQICLFLATCKSQVVWCERTSRCFSSLGYVSTNTPKPVKLSMFPNTGPAKGDRAKMKDEYEFPLR